MPDTNAKSQASTRTCPTVAAAAATAPHLPGSQPGLGAGRQAQSRMLVLGATSDIAQELVRAWVRAVHDSNSQLKQEGPWHLHLMGRNLNRLESLRQEVVSSCPEVTCSCSYFDTGLNSRQMVQCFQQACELSGGVFTHVFCAVGFLGSQHQAEAEIKRLLPSLITSYETRATSSAATAEPSAPDGSQVPEPLEAVRIMEVNYTGLILMLELAAAAMEQSGQGRAIMVVSSVAGERGRRSNYFYGASKAAMTAYLSGLRVRMTSAGKTTWGKPVQVLTIKPGYVATKMVAGRRLPPYITASCDTVAQDIIRAYLKRKDVLYTMWLWRYILAAARMLPECCFKRLSRF